MSAQSRRSDNLSETIADFTGRARLRDISWEVRQSAVLHLLDGFATMLAGVNDEASRRIRRYLLNLGGRGKALVIGTQAQMPAQHAALANGVQGHVLDYDDAQLATLSSRPMGQQTHPTSPVLAAALSLAQTTRASGPELLEAYIVGIEVACRLGDAIDPSHYLDGFHPTGTISPFGAAAACARLLKLNKQQIGWALGIAGTLASGIRANRGTMAKALNAGRAAENGVVAATLAQQNFTATTNVFGDPMGFFSAACRNKVDLNLLKFGAPYFLEKPGVAIKLYPCPGVLHPMLDLLLSQIKRYDLRPEQIQAIRITMSPEMALPLVYDRPQNGLQGKFSLPFTAAVAVVDREVGIGQFADARVRDRQIKKLMQRVMLIRMPGPSHRRKTPPTEVEILGYDGRRYRQNATWARGHPTLPPSRQEIEEKFRQCAGPVLKNNAVEQFLTSVWFIERVSSVSRWLRPLRSPRR
jgi:2-methylcitrate dehydratase PrpD